jgi:8-oxo-dGTP pyrophosphatase MutT (NUDIX family)
MLAAIRPGGKPEGLWVLPKGQIDEGESAEAAAVREVGEETGVNVHPIVKLGDSRYWFNWEGERIFKVVSFFLVRYESGRLGELAKEFRHEVDAVRWLRLADAPALMAYAGEREMVERAAVALAEQDV